MSTAESLIRAYFEAFNRHDAEGLLGTLHEDVVHDINEGPTESGLEAFRQFKARMDASYSEQISDLVVYASGDRGAAEFTCLGRYLKTDGEFPPAQGQEYSIRAAAFFQIRDDKISRVTSYYNLKRWIEAIQ